MEWARFNSYKTEVSLVSGLRWWTDRGLPIVFGGAGLSRNLPCSRGNIFRAMPKYVAPFILAPRCNGKLGPVGGRPCAKRAMHLPFSAVSGSG